MPKAGHPIWREKKTQLAKLGFFFAANFIQILYTLLKK
jgi:hypothetical protein